MLRVGFGSLKIRMVIIRNNKGWQGFPAIFFLFLYNTNLYICYNMIASMESSFLIYFRFMLAFFIRDGMFG